MTVSRGWYRHYKGHVYYAHGVACLKHENDRRVVIYTSVKTEQEGRFDFLARDEKEFEELVEVEIQQEGPVVMDVLLTEKVPRFARITDPEKSIVPT